VYVVGRTLRGRRGRAAVGGIALFGALLGGIFAGMAVADDPPRSIGGVTYRHDVVSVTPPGQFLVDVMCPTGTHVSGGASTSESGTQGEVQMSAPGDGPDADRLPDDLWRARHAFRSSEGPQGLNADVICLGGGLTYESRTIVLHAGEPGTVTAPCGPSRHVAGGGAVLARGGPASYVNSSYPWDSADAGTVPDDGWTARAYNGTGGGDLSLRVYATCVSTSPAYFKAGQSVAPGSADFAHAPCPQTRHLIGAGARVSGPAFDAVLTGTSIGDGSDPDLAPDDTVDAGTRVIPGAFASRNLTAFAICRV